ncbi:hypothetical protein FRX31_030977, partial [Thalictrum thalictroides]
MEGEVLCAYSGNDICNSVFHQEGLKLALFLNVRSLEVASDFLSVTRAINKLEKPPWDCEDQFKRIWDLAYDFAQIIFYHVFRETNRAADFLARIGTDQDSSILYFISPLCRELCSIVEDDKNNKVYLRFNQY